MLDAAATVSDSAVDIEAQIKSAMIARTPYFEKQAEYVRFRLFYFLLSYVRRCRSVLKCEADAVIRG